MPIWGFGSMSLPKNLVMFFSNGNPTHRRAGYCFVSVTANFPNSRFIYSFKAHFQSSFDADLLYGKLDRILDLLQDQHYTELNKLMGTMTLKEVASYLSKSTRTIERRIEKGMLKAVSKEGNADLFSKKDVVQLYLAEYKKWPKRMP